MHVQNAQAQMPPLNTHETYATRTNMGDDQKSASKASSGRASDTPPATNNAVTGTTNSKLSSEVMQYVISSTQEVETANALFPKATQNGLNDVANDPRAAEKRAKELGMGVDLVAWDHIPGTQAGDPPYAVIIQNLKDLKQMTSKVQNERQTIYEKGLAEGTPPAHLVLKLLDFNANLPQSYGDKLDQRTNSKPHKWQSEQQGMANYLRQAIAQANSSKATEELS